MIPLRIPESARPAGRAAALIATATAWLAFMASAGAADQWPQWRGPENTGVAPEASPPIEWSETRNVKWKFEIPGGGTSTPIIWDNQVFLLTAIPVPEAQAAEEPAAGASPSSRSESPADQPPGRRGRGGGARRAPADEPPPQRQQFVVLSVDRESGKERWRRVVREEVPHEGHHRDHGFASYSPVTDGERLYVHFGSRGLHACDLEGNLHWQRDLGRMQTKMGFGEGGSPALHGDILVVKWDHEGDDFIAAFDKNTGRELWRQPRDEATSWSSPLIVEHRGRAQVIVSATGLVKSYDLETGREIWSCGGMTDNAIPTPVAGFDMVYLLSGFRGSALLAVRLDSEGDVTETESVAWRYGRNTPYVPSPLLYGHRLYFHAGNNAMLSCFDARDGRKLIDAERLPGLAGVYASPLGAADRVYLVGREGGTLVIRHGDTLEILATNKLDDRFDASPAAVDRQLFLRGHRHLYCLEEG